MLLELTIKDFAIIDSLHLRLHRLFNVFTGETGAGKSIIIDAVNALLGGKIGAEYVRAGCERATVEGVFSIEALPAISDEWLSLETDEDGDALPSIGANGASTVFEALDQAETRSMQRLQVDAASADARVALAALLHEYDITPDNGILILSRDIFRSSGRTVARINGRALSQQVLQQVASWLVDIHGQSEHMSLLRPEQHINFLDRYAEQLSQREELSKKVTTWRNARKQLQDVIQDEAFRGEIPIELEGAIDSTDDAIAQAVRCLESTASEKAPSAPPPGGPTCSRRRASPPTSSPASCTTRCAGSS